MADYQAKMKSFLADLGKVEAAIKAGDNAGATELMKTLKRAFDPHNILNPGKTVPL